jgi:hypothetical protein
MIDNVTAVFRAYRQAADAHDAALAHPDLGQKNAKGFSAKGQLQHARDVLKEAEINWERVRLQFLGEQAEREAGELPLGSS